VHSYQANTTEEYIVASLEYGTQIPAIVQKGIILVSSILLRILTQITYIKREAIKLVRK
jgi:hypothetical protein